MKTLIISTECEEKVTNGKKTVANPIRNIVALQSPLRVDSLTLLLIVASNRHVEPLCAYQHANLSFLHLQTEKKKKRKHNSSRRDYKNHFYPPARNGSEKKISLHR